MNVNVFMSCVVAWVIFPFFDRFCSHSFLSSSSRMNNNLKDLGPTNDANSDTLQTSTASGFLMAMVEGLGVADRLCDKAKELRCSAAAVQPIRD